MLPTQTDAVIGGASQAIEPKGFRLLAMHSHY